MQAVSMRPVVYQAQTHGDATARCPFVGGDHANLNDATNRDWSPLRWTGRRHKIGRPIRLATPLVQRVPARRSPQRLDAGPHPSNTAFPPGRALAYLDLWMTLLASQMGLSELNPLMGRLLARPEKLFLVKGVAPALIALVVPGKLLVPAIGFLLAVAAWNIAQLASVL